MRERKRDGERCVGRERGGGWGEASRGAGWAKGRQRKYIGMEYWELKARWFFSGPIISSLQSGFSTWYD